MKLFFALVMFGSNSVIVTFITLSSFQIVFMRTLLGGIVLVSVLVLSRKQMNIRENLVYYMYVAFSGVGMALCGAFLYMAIDRIGVSYSILICYCAPALVIMVSPFLFGERLTWIKITGFAAVFIGQILLNGKIVLEEGDRTGFLFAALSAIMYAVMVILNKKGNKKVTGLKNATVQLVFGLLTATAVLITRGELVFHIAGADWPLLFFLGIINTGICCYIYFSSFAYLPVQTISICAYVEPLAAVVLAAIILHETMTFIQIAGAVMIIGGATFAESSRTQFKHF